MTTEPPVSVVTPFYNSADFLESCIVSVIGQDYPDFEYVLVDNSSTDESHQIAASFAAKDSRIRLVRHETFLPQIENYNRALQHVRSGSRYIKMVQADDALLPGCLREMTRVGEAHPSAAIISSYRIAGQGVSGGGIEWPTTLVSGREAARLYLFGRHFVFGSMTTVMYRSHLLRLRRPFLSPTTLRPDTDLCLEVLQSADLGFVHQVLSFTRTGNAGSVLASRQSFDWPLVGLVVALERFGPAYGSALEFERRRAEVWEEYKALLARAMVGGRSREYWAYQRRAMMEAGCTLPSPLSVARFLPRVLASRVRRALRRLGF